MNNLTFSKIVKLLLIILIFIFLLSKKKLNPLLCLDKNRVIFLFLVSKIVRSCLKFDSIYIVRAWGYSCYSISLCYLLCLS